MRTGRPRTVLVTLTPKEQQQLETWARGQAIGSGLQRRARMLLLVAQGSLPITSIAPRVGLSRMAVYKWLARFQQAGVTALIAKHPPGGGRPRKAVTPQAPAPL